MSDPNNEPVSKQNLFRRLDEGWEHFNAYLRTLNTDQLAEAHDANGWSIKDFIVHLACWEQGVASVLRKQSFADAMGVDKAIYDGGVEQTNALLQQRYHYVTLAEALTMIRQSHDQLIAAVNYLDDEDLLRPIRDFDPDSTSDQPIIALIVGNSIGHYAEHLPWLAAMVQPLHDKKGIAHE